MIRVKDLTPGLLMKWPVWTWDDTEEWLVPVLEKIPFVKSEPTYFVRSSFVADDGTEFNGYLIGCDSFFAFGLFAEDQEFVFNVTLPKFIHSNIAAIEKILGIKSLNLFPLQYDSDVRFADSNKIHGKLAF